MTLEIRDFEARDHTWARRLLADHSGGTHLQARLGELIDPLTKPGLVAERDGQPVALATIDEGARGMEIVTLHSIVRGIGAGTRLLETALHIAVVSGDQRLWLVTTNDNLEAIRFYLRRGMRVVSVHEGAVELDRAGLKPQIPTVNSDNGLEVRDLVELELPTDAGETLTFSRFPRLEDLNALPIEPAGDLLTILFERAWRFVVRLAAARPFESDEQLMAVAREIARSMPEEEQVELINAHPRIGADPDSVSAFSHREQGYGAEAALTADDPAATEIARVYEELAMLNEIYERRHGFRYLVFVAGRPKAEIVPLLERAITHDREAELRRALDDTVYIAADRLATLRSEEIAT